MCQTLEIVPGFIDVSVAPASIEVLPSRAMPSSRQLLAASLDALFRRQNTTAIQAQAATGIDNGTISKFQTVEGKVKRWPTAEHFDALATFFSVPPYVLLKPDEAMGNALTQQGSLRIDNDPVKSAAPLYYERSAGLAPDAALFRKLSAYWSVLDPVRQAELVRFAWELSDPSTERTPAPFKTG